MASSIRFLRSSENSQVASSCLRKYYANAIMSRLEEDIHAGPILKFLQTSHRKHAIFLELRYSWQRRPVRSPDPRLEIHLSRSVCFYLQRVRFRDSSRAQLGASSESDLLFLADQQCKMVIVNTGGASRLVDQAS